MVDNTKVTKEMCEYLAIDLSKKIVDTIENMFDKCKMSGATKILKNGFGAEYDPDTKEFTNHTHKHHITLELTQDLAEKDYAEFNKRVPSQIIKLIKKLKALDPASNREWVVLQVGETGYIEIYFKKNVFTVYETKSLASNNFNNDRGNRVAYATSPHISIIKCVEGKERSKNDKAFDDIAKLIEETKFS